jgi:IS30 family transposase
MAGWTYRDVAAEFSVSAMTVSRIRHDREVRRQVYASRGSRLSLSEREEISRGLAQRWTFTRIAGEIGRDVSTISREVGGVEGRDQYRAAAAHAEACERARRRKPTKFQRHRRLAFTVENWLANQQWSPEQISARLKIEFPDDELMRVTPETIYQPLYVHGRGGLRKELTKHLRSQRTQRRPRTTTARNRAGSPIADMVNIAERPDDVEDRLVPGHWEGDLIMGRNKGSQVDT